MICESWCYTNEELDAFENKCLDVFRGIGGNMPFPEFVSKFGKRYVGEREIPVAERLYLASNPFAVSGLPKAGLHYDWRILKLDEVRSVSGFRFVSLSTRKTVVVDIRDLMQSGINSEGKIYRSNGLVNRHIAECLKNAVPYLTLREVMEETVRFIGREHVFFTIEEVKVRPRWWRGQEYDDLVERDFYHCHLAQGVNPLSK